MKDVQIGSRKYTAYWLSSILGFLGFVLTMIAFIFISKEGVEANLIATLGYIYLGYQLVLSGAFFGLNVVDNFADAKKMLIKNDKPK